MSTPTGWTSFAEARARILADIQPIQDSDYLPVEDALLRVLADNICAPFNVPGHDNSAMDGYACRLADVTAGAARLRVSGSAFAGAPYDGAISAGDCVRIMTGAKLPAGCEVIIPQEETKAADNGSVLIQENSKRRAGQHMRLAGEDLKYGDIALTAGTLCYPAQVGLLASLGLTEVHLMRQLRVACFSTGDEIRSAGEPLGDSDVYDSNRHTLRTMIQRMGFTVIDLGIVPDNRDRLAEAMDKAQSCADAVITSGGASVGEADYIRAVLAERGEVLFWKVAMRPGRPLAYGKIGGVDFFGLPGNPVSVMVCFYQFVREALWKRAGRRGDTALPILPAVTTGALRKVPGRMEFQRGNLTQHPDGSRTVTVTGDQGSGILSSMTQGNCFIVLPPDCERVEAGDTVNVQLFEGLI